MSTASYNCPCCGAPLAFIGESGRLECAACGNSYEPEALEMLNASESGEQISFERPKEGFRAEEGVQAYLCKNCGAELMTEDTTTAAECPYCGSVVTCNEYGWTISQIRGIAQKTVKK